MKCLLDLDGVLADFHTQWHRFHDRVYPDPWPNGIWSLATVHDITWEESCRNLTLGFWQTMPWMHDGKKILALIESYFGPGNTCLLTSNHVEDAAMAAYGKVQWIEEQMPAYKHRYFLGADKRFLAHKGVVLIDDKNENVDSFIAEGGTAFLLPRPWNRRYLDSGNSVAHLADFLMGIGLDNRRAT